ncbi:PREDICTED: centrosomal protein of 131 kDa-like [Branchiostoma belcheri]|uniref:Centrosomal protein of 131 kDa-like n=1 Tax=Branchiostoma belcheri TaxID=7741 RepID=A0A6P4XDW0_BRABE|nr:PREDICTED: centrosomal protein of 131 kDa-like [Branchiostoma belcheri]
MPTPKKANAETPRGSDLDLSLTGSQLSMVSGNKRVGSSATQRPGSASQRPGSASQRPGSASAHRPGSAGRPSTADSRRGRGTLSQTVNGYSSGAQRKHRRAGSHNPADTQRSNTSESSGSTGLTPVGRGAQNLRRPASASKLTHSNPRTNEAGDDFLSLFDTPKVKKQLNRDRPPSVGAVRVLPPGMPEGSPFKIPLTDRTDSTMPSSPLNSERSPPANVLNSERSPPPNLLNSERSPPAKQLNLPNNATVTRGAPAEAHVLRNIGASSGASPTSPSANQDLSLPRPKQGSPPGRRGVPKTISKAEAELYINRVNKAATRIQRWYRACKEKEQRESEETVKRLLAQKREEREDMMRKEQNRRMAEMEDRRKQEEEKRRRREEKERQARQAAIQELQRKREEKRAEPKQKSEGEISFLQPSGKVTKKVSRPASAKPKVRTKKRSSPVKRAGSESDSEMTESEVGGQRSPQQRPGTASTVRKVDEMFDEPQGATAAPDTQAETDRDDLTTLTDSKTKTTLNDLLDTIKMLEEEPEKFPTPRKSRAWGSDEEKDNGYLSSEKLEKLNHPPRTSAGGLPGVMLTEDKLRNNPVHRSIMSFLDEVEKADDEVISQVTSQVTKSVESTPREDPASAAAPPPVLLVPSAEEIAQMEQASATASEVASEMLKQRLELEEKQRSVAMLQKALNQQRELTIRHAREGEKEMKHRLQVQKEEYEATIKRHLGFIDQLIDDKKALGEKCERVVKELKDMDAKYSKRIKDMSDKHNEETQKIKDMHAAAEKLRREKWIDEKTKKIKEMTVKGLEPEIQRLIAKHKQEVKKIKAIHEAELLEADERASRRFIHQTEEIKEQMGREIESACNRERELAKQRYEKQAEQEEQGLQQQRRRLYAEVQEEKERIATQAAKQRGEIDRMKEQLEDTSSKAVETMRREYEKARDEQERRHAAEVKQLQDRLKVEKEAWEENYMKKQDTWLLQKERELKETVKRDRDKEIELVIQRLDEDASSQREEVERAAENRMKRMREKYEAEMRELERSERTAMDKYNDMKAELIEVEGENARLKGLLRQKEQELEDINKVKERLTQERNNMSEVIRQEFADRLVATEEENRRVKNEISEMRARHKMELDRITREKEEEMEEVHKRVKSAIVKKEDTVNQLRKQYEAAVKRADHLEGLLEQQRKQLLKK